jgi:hypothetical protein
VAVAAVLVAALTSRLREGLALEVPLDVLTLTSVPGVQERQGRVLLVAPEPGSSMTAVAVAVGRLL